MKKAFFLLLFIPLFSFSQGCLPEGINFTNQNQIDQFPSNYPDCDSILGIVNVFGEDITNLDSLSQLVYCENRFHIQQCPNLISVEGLKNLKSLGNSFIIEFCTELESLKGLDNLTSVGNDFMLWDNYSVKNLEGLSNLSSVGNNFVIHWMDGLTTLDGISKLSNISGNLVVWKNDSIESLAALNVVDSVGTGIAIISNPLIKNLYGLDDINLLSGTINIEFNESLDNMLALSDYQSDVLDSVMIFYNPMLSECNIDLLCNLIDVNPSILNIHDNKTGCNTAEEIEENCNVSGCFSDGLHITQQSQIDSFPINYPNCSVIEGDLRIDGEEILSLHGLSQLRKVNGRFSMMNCYELNRLEGLEGLYEIGNEFYFWHNDLLKNVDALSGLHKVGGLINFYSNDSLQNINGLSGLREVSSLEIGSNWSLKDISGLSKLRNINGDFIFTFNHQVTDFESLKNLSEIGGKLSIHACAGLKNINGFENINELPGGLQISNCDSLTDLSGLRNLKSVGGSCYLTNCKSLKTLDGFDSLIDVGNWGVLNLSSIKNFEGLNPNLTIHGNLSIDENDSLISFKGLENTEFLKGSLTVKYNHQLQSFEDLRGLKSISDGIYIRGNESIKNLRGLENVVDFKGQIGIVDNSNLRTLEGLDHISTDSISRFEITENPQLYLCHVPSICEFIEDIPDSIYINVSDNVYGCNNIDEINEWCFINSQNIQYFPLYQQQPHWSVLDKERKRIETLQTHQFEYLKDTVICGKYYSKIPMENSIIYVRQDSLKYYYRIGLNCESKEYLLYDFNLTWGGEAYLGWGQHEHIQKDTALFVVTNIDYVEQNGNSRRRITLANNDVGNSFSGRLNWVEGIGSLEHPFYPFALMDVELNHNYELLCYDSVGVQLYKNPNYNTCDTNYTLVNDIQTNDFTFSPNPFKNQLNIDLGSEKILDIKLYTITGAELPIQWTKNGQSTQIKVFDRQYSGICLLQISLGATVHNYKLLRHP